MPKCKEREYRALMTPLQAKTDEKRINTEYYVEGYATTFDDEYLLFEFEDGTKVFEVIEKNALKDADMTDVIMQFDHEGRVYARQSNGTLLLETDNHGFFVAGDLSRTAGARDLYADIDAGMITKMSWAFTIASGGEYWVENREAKTIVRHITKVKKVYDVSAVSIPANDDTEISARSSLQGRIAAEQLEQLQKRAKLLKLKTMLM